MTGEKQTKLWVGIIIVIIIIAGIWYGVGRKPAQTTNESIKTVKIGAILPLSGKLSSYGEHMKEGIELAKDEINSQGGIKGKKLEVIYEDSQGDTKQGITAYHKLVDTEGIKVLLSSLSGVTLGIAPLAEKDKVVVFAIGTAAPSISKAGDFIFRHNLLPQTEAKTLADLIYNKKGYKKIAGMFVNTESGVSYRDEFVKDYKDLGGEMESIEMYEKGTTDFRTQLTKIKDSGVKAVFTCSYIKELGYILKQSRELGLDVQWFGIYAAEGPELLEIAGNAAEGLIYTHFFNPASPSMKEYQRKYKERYGKPSEFYAALAYDNVKILSEVIGRCSGAKDSICIKNELYQIKDFPGVTGPITFDENGDTHKEVVIKTVKNGKFVPYEK